MQVVELVSRHGASSRWRRFALTCEALSGTRSNVVKLCFGSELRLHGDIGEGRQAGFDSR